MKLKATIEVEYEVNPIGYLFSKSENKKKIILKFERIALLTIIEDLCDESAAIVTVVEIE